MEPRSLRGALTTITVACGIATLVGIVTASDSTPFIAVSFFLLVCANLIADIGAWRRLHERDPLDEEETNETHEFKVGVRAAVRIGLMLCAAFMAAFVIVSLSVGWRATFFGAAVVFCALVIFGGPIWLASIGEEEEDDHETRTGEHRASR